MRKEAEILSKSKSLATEGKVVGFVRPLGTNHIKGKGGESGGGKKNFSNTSGTASGHSAKRVLLFAIGKKEGICTHDRDGGGGVHNKGKRGIYPVQKRGK